MSAIRSPAVAGTFYPAGERELSESVDRMLDACEADGPVPKVIIAPHAGHIYSGSVAARAYCRLKPARNRIHRVVLLGPSHRVGFRGIAAPSSNAYRTPLGDIPIDAGAIRNILALPGTGFLDEAHVPEHSLEVHLPFLQRVLDSFSLVPLVVGEAPKEEVAAVLDALWGGPETLIVISTDLSHYHPYDEAREIDAATARKIVSLDASIRGDEACGCRPLNGLIHLVRDRGLSIEPVTLENSGDTAGDRERVVGYGAWVIHERGSAARSMPLAHRQRLIQVARNAVFEQLTRNDTARLNPDDYPASFAEERASFVTLNLHGRLRGCIGSLVPHRTLVSDVVHNALAAAFHDPRFPALTLDEYQDTDFHISVLSIPETLAVGSLDELLSVLRPGVDGLIIQENGRQATYLPSVWEQLPHAPDFVRELRKKAGLPADGWDRSTRVQRYTTEEFS